MAVVEHSDLLRRHIIKCDLCKRRASIEVADKQGWDWFTGILRRTMHYCPEHSKTPERNRAFEKSRETAAIRAMKTANA